MRTGKRVVFAAAVVVGSIASVSAPATAATSQIARGSPAEGVTQSAGESCPVVVDGDPAFWTGDEAVPGDRQWSHHVGTATWATLVTGLSFAERSGASDVAIDEAVSRDHVQGGVDGRALIWFFPGEVGPAGVPVTYVETYSLVGYVTYTLDLVGEHLDRVHPRRPGVR